MTHPGTDQQKIKHRNKIKSIVASFRFDNEYDMIVTEKLKIWEFSIHYSFIHPCKTITCANMKSRAHTRARIQL